MSHPESASQLRALLTSRGLAPNKRYGQNFLIEPRLLDVVARLAGLAPGDVVLEVGTGTGNLTHRLAEVCKLVVSVEIDAGIHALARDLLGNSPAVRLIHGDILDGKSSLNAEVCDKLDVALAEQDTAAFKVVANLPYNVSTPFLSSLLIRYGPPDVMVLMVQKELAQNLSAAPGTKEYSPLSVFISMLCDVSIERTVAREVFWPKPRVDSAIVLATSRGLDATSVLRAFPLVQFLFKERRKTLGNVLKKLPPIMGGPLSQDVLDVILERMELDGTERAETLTPETFLKLDRTIADVSDGG